jgi:CHAD domain-containing protein
MTLDMASHLRRSEAATSGLRRLLFLQLDRSRRLLAGPPLDDAAIHALRRILKQCQALLLLLRPALGKAAWRRERAAIDAVARGYGPQRDQRVLHDTVDALARHSGDPVFDAFAAAIRREAGQSAGERTDGMARASRFTLNRCRVRLRRLRLTRRNWSLLGPALRRSYRAARRARAEALAGGGDTALHDWRRFAKYLWHQVELLEPLDADVAGFGVRMHALTDLLGRYHDLVVLRERVTQSSSLAEDAAGGARFLALLDATLAALKIESLAAGEGLFVEKPRDFEKRLRDHWRAWRRAQASSDSRR